MILTKEHNKILSALAKRKGCPHPNLWNTRRISRGLFLSDNQYCYICCKDIPKCSINIFTYPDAEDKINEHGLQHLKDFNLISFV